MVGLLLKTAFKKANQFYELTICHKVNETTHITL